MKKNKKLNLNKLVIAKLSKNEKSVIKGGADTLLKYTTPNPTKK